MNEKIDPVKRVPVPHSVFKLRSFERASSNTHSFLPDLATKLAPLPVLFEKKGVQWEWSVSKRSLQTWSH